MKKIGMLVLFVSALFMISVAGVQAAEKITTAGSNTVRAVVAGAAQAFKKTHPDVSFVVGGGGTPKAFEGLMAGEIDLGQMSRPLKEKDMKKIPDLMAFTIAMDGIAVLVNSDNPVTAITKEQIQDIYTGKITNWKEIGGNDAPIILISKGEGRSTTELFLKYFGMEAEGVGEEPQRMMVHKKKGDSAFGTAKAQMIIKTKAALGFLSTKKNAIIYVSLGPAQKLAEKSGRVRLLDLDGIPATIENVSNEIYPLRRPLNVITKGQPQGSVKEFIDFMLSEEGQNIVESLDFIKVAAR